MSFSNTEEVERACREHLYAHHPGSTMNVLLLLLCHSSSIHQPQLSLCMFIFYAFQNKLQISLILLLNTSAVTLSFFQVGKLQPREVSRLARGIQQASTGARQQLLPTTLCSLLGLFSFSGGLSESRLLLLKRFKVSITYILLDGAALSNIS